MSNDTTNDMTDNTKTNGTSESEQGNSRERITAWRQRAMSVAESRDEVAFLARTGLLENPPAAGALDRVTLGRVAHDAWHKALGMPHHELEPHWLRHDSKLTEANCLVGEAVAAYVLSQTPEPVELDRDWLGSELCQEWNGDSVKWHDRSWGTKDVFSRIAVKFARAVLARYAAPTPPDPRRVVEGMRVRVTEKTEGMWGARERTVHKVLGGWEAVDDSGTAKAGFGGDTLPPFLDPLPAEPVEATPPIPEPAGEIVLPEDAAGNIKFDDTSMVLPSVKFEGKWFAITKDGWNLKDVAERTAYFPTPKAAAIALRDIGQGPGAAAPKCRICGERPSVSDCDGMCGMCYMGTPGEGFQKWRAEPTAQPDPPLSIPWRTPDSFRGYCGDRIIGVYECRESEGAPMRKRAVVLTCEETGWECEDGIGIESLDAYVTEKDLLASLEAQPAPQPFDVERLAERSFDYALGNCCIAKSATYAQIMEFRGSLIMDLVSELRSALGGKE